MDNPPRNIPKAIRNLEKSAELGFATAQATLGMINFAGGVKKFGHRLKVVFDGSSKENPSRYVLPRACIFYRRWNPFKRRLQCSMDSSLRRKELTMAQLTLGMKLALGDGVEELELAVQWLREQLQRVR